ncbi:MAG: NRDE family protein [Balneolaceae bacterium]|nr:NRDE family protein [Balneolaceae bacterium]
MCLITFAYKVHPEYRLILASNRDEFYSRPTRKAQHWFQEGFPNLIAGKDLEAGGTWMGVTENARWAALTNYRDPKWQVLDPPSRGQIVLNYLKKSGSSIEFIKELDLDASHYAGFNVLIADSKELYHYSNYNQIATLIKPGIHGVSNALLDTPWPKLDKAKSDLEQVISRKGPIKKEEIFDILANPTQASDNDLPETGIPYEWEKAVSSIFIKTETYGTRCSTVLLIKNNGEVELTERRFTPDSDEFLEENTYSLQS